MEYDMSCACGRAQRVSIGLAGATLECDCGRLLRVPSSIVMREQLGLPGLVTEPEFVIRGMFTDRQLPARTCVFCGTEGAANYRVQIECEATWSPSTGSDSAVAGMAFGVLGTIVGELLLYVTASSDVCGREVVVPAVLVGCQRCAQRVAPRRVGGVTRFFGWVAGIAGFVMLFADRPAPGSMLLGLSVGSHLISVWRRWAEQRRLRTLICGISEYNRLFRKYPAARIHF